jgi:hypothetical protein
MGVRSGRIRNGNVAGGSQTTRVTALEALPQTSKNGKNRFLCGKQLHIHLRLGFVQNNAKVNEICTVFSVTRIDLF